MQSRVITKDNAVFSSWGGGIGRQYFIYPPESSYAQKNFSVRISVAETSTDAAVPYTVLPHITRYLVMLEGNAVLSHAAKHKGAALGGEKEVLLAELETVHVFDGGLETSSKGKVKDFNLMLGPGAKGNLSIHDGNEIDAASYLISDDVQTVFTRTQFERSGRSWLGLFCARGSAGITENETASPSGQTYTLHNDDLYLCEKTSCEMLSHEELRRIKIKSDAGSKIMIISAAIPEL
jgi:environmental stress-induced protein Ves